MDSRKNCDFVKSPKKTGKQNYKYLTILTISTSQLIKLNPLNEFWISYSRLNLQSVVSRLLG